MSISGQIDESMRMSGRTINWKVWESSPGLMVANTKINISTIRKKALASSSGPNGRKYIGDWKNGKEQVIHIYSSASGKKKRGEWNEGKSSAWLN